MIASLFVSFGNDELKREFLAPTISGDIVACLGVSEVGAGSDVSSNVNDILCLETGKEFCDM